MVHSRLNQSPSNSQLNSRTFKLCKQISILSVIGLFCVVESALVTLSFFEIISLKTLFIELCSCIGLIVVGVNMYQFVLAVRMREIPYKSRKHQQYVRQVGIVCFVWTIAFMIKLMSVGYGHSLFQTDLENIDVYQACVLGLTDYLSIVIPYYTVVDSDFVGIMWCNHINQDPTFAAD